MAASGLKNKFQPTATALKKKKKKNPKCRDSWLGLHLNDE